MNIYSKIPGYERLANPGKNRVDPFSLTLTLSYRGRGIYRSAEAIPVGKA